MARDTVKVRVRKELKDDLENLSGGFSIGTFLSIVIEHWKESPDRLKWENYLASLTEADRQSYAEWEAKTATGDLETPLVWCPEDTPDFFGFLEGVIVRKKTGRPKGSKNRKRSND